MAEERKDTGKQPAGRKPIRAGETATKHLLASPGVNEKFRNLVNALHATDW